MENLAELVERAVKQAQEELKIEDVKSLTPREMIKRGGKWLGAARTWMQWNRNNGDTVGWGSHEPLRPAMTAHDMEEYAAEVAIAAMQEIAEKIDNNEKMRKKYFMQSAELTYLREKYGEKPWDNK